MYHRNPEYELLSVPPHRDNRSRLSNYSGLSGEDYEWHEDMSKSYGKQNGGANQAHYSLGSSFFDMLSSDQDHKRQNSLKAITLSDLVPYIFKPYHTVHVHSIGLLR